MDDKKTTKIKKSLGGTRKSTPVEARSSPVDEYDRTVILERVKDEFPSTPPSSPLNTPKTHRAPPSPTPEHASVPCRDSPPKALPKRTKRSAEDEHGAVPAEDADVKRVVPALKVFCCVDHDAPLGIPPASVIVASDEGRAISLLNEALVSRNLAPKSEKDYTLHEVNTSSPSATLLSVHTHGGFLSRVETVKKTDTRK